MAATCLSRSALAGIKGDTGLGRSDYLTASAFTPGLHITPPGAKRAVPRGSLTVRNVATKPPAKTSGPSNPKPSSSGAAQARFFRDGTPTLPQHADKEEQQRRQFIREENRKDYAVQWDLKPFTPLADAIPILQKLPVWEQFSIPYIGERVLATVASLANAFILTLDLPAPKQLAPVSVTPAQEAQQKKRFERSDALGLIRNLINWFGWIWHIPDMTADRIKNFKDFKGVFFLIDKPKSSDDGNWKSDEFFGHQRLAGPNPVALKRANATNRVPHIAEFTAAFDGKLKIDEKVTAGTLFYIDYETELSVTPFPSVRPADPITGPPAGRFFPRPVALFTSDKNKKSVVPLAVYINGKVYSAAHSNKLEWEVAKLCVTVADGNLHEMVAHLGRTHFVLQSFNIATCMELPFQHPLRLLLDPHFRFLLNNNALGVQFLIGYGGSVDTLMGPTLEESVALAVKGVKTWTYQDFVFEKELANRGFDKFGFDDPTLSHYPFRDDGKLIWDAIYNYVSSYVDLYYSSEEDVAGDYELQAWAKQVGSKDLGRITDFPENIATRKELSDILAVIIWTGSGLHCAVNFTQYDYMAYVPTGSLALYADFEKALEDVAGSKEGFLDALFGPSLEKKLLETGLLATPKATIDQLQIMSFLSAYRYDKLGYEKTHVTGKSYFFTDPNAQAVQKQFQDTLAKAQAVIEERNKERLANVASYADYKVLLPEKILNSTSI